MAQKRTLTLTLHVDGLKEALRAISKLPKDAQVEVRDRALTIAEGLAIKLRVAARGESAQAGLMAPTIRARRDRVPSVEAGGTRRVGRKRKPAYKILFGSEFGSHLPQFKPHLGRGSYWFYKTFEDNQEALMSEWAEAVNEVADKWGRSG